MIRVGLNVMIRVSLRVFILAFAIGAYASNHVNDTVISTGYVYVMAGGHVEAKPGANLAAKHVPDIKRNHALTLP